MTWTITILFPFLQKNISNVIRYLFIGRLIKIGKANNVTRLKLTDNNFEVEYNNTHDLIA